jgi:hypothetical protein
MPLLSATGGVADHICAACGAETHYTSADWIYDDADPGAFSTPPCSCGAVESFSWHDWTYIDHKGEPDHAHVGARQQVLIERIGQALGRTKAKHADRIKKPYKEPPRAPTQNEVRDHVKRMRGQA